MISQIIIKRIESEFGQRVRYPKDCDALSIHIHEKTKQLVSSSTLKRLFGFIKGTKDPREYTLDVIAAYLNCSSYEDLLVNLEFTPKIEKKLVDEVDQSKLPKGQIIEISLDEKRRLHLKKTSEKFYIVILSDDDFILPGDKISLLKIQLHYPLIIQSTIRSKIEIGERTLCRLSGIMGIELK